MDCQKCKGAGLVWADLQSFGFGQSFVQFMAIGCKVRYGDDGSVRHEIVCPQCNGTGKTEEQPNGL